MKIKLYYLPLASALIAGIFLGIQITLLVQEFVPFPSFFSRLRASYPD